MGKNKIESVVLKSRASSNILENLNLSYNLNNLIIKGKAIMSFVIFYQNLLFINYFKIKEIKTVIAHEI